MKHFILKQVTLSQLLGVGRAYVSQMVNDQSPITTKVVNKLIESFPKVNSNWLLTGNGVMLLDSDMVNNYQIEEGRTRTREELEKDHKDDPLFGLKEVLADYETRIAALEDRIDAMEREAKVGYGGRS